LHRLPQQKDFAVTTASPIKRRHAVLVACLAILLLFVVFRWHAITYNECIMVDESTFLVDAIRANSSGYVPWYNYDNITSGPLNVLPVALLLKLGFPANHQTVHLYATLVMALAHVFLLIAVVRICGLWPGVAIGVGGALIFALQQAPDFSHYSSGLVPFLLLAAGWVAGLRKSADGFVETTVPRLFFAFLFFACAPLAKMQAGPPAVACCLTLATLFTLQQFHRRDFARMLCGWGAILAGGLVPPLIVVASIWAAGDPAYFLASIGALTSYAGAPPLVRTLKDVVFLVINAESRFIFAPAIAAAFAVSALVYGFARRTRPEYTKSVARTVLLLGMLLWVAAALYAVALPDKMAGIYEVFLYAPVLFALGAFVAWLDTERLPSEFRSFLPVVIACAFGAVASVMLGPALKKNVTNVGQEPISSLPMDAENRTASALKEMMASPEDKLWVWGWAPAVHVHSGLLPATRIPFMHVSFDAFSPIYREAVLGDVRREKPRFIVDAAQSGFAMNSIGTWIGYYDPSRDLSAQGFYPELVSMGYRLAREVPLADGSKALIYERDSDPDGH
jgi:hypothetical protein